MLCVYVHPDVNALGLKVLRQPLGDGVAYITSGSLAKFVMSESVSASTNKWGMSKLFSENGRYVFSHTLGRVMAVIKVCGVSSRKLFRHANHNISCNTSVVWCCVQELLHDQNAIIHPDLQCSHLFHFSVVISWSK